MTAPDTRTNWDIYYGKKYKITSFTRKTTENLLLKLLRTFGGDLKTKSIVELGGANSCFYEAIKNEISPKKYHVIDNNELGLELFKLRTAKNSGVSFENANVLFLEKNESHDLVFSIGLIEHFDQKNTARAIKAHFDILKPGGIVIMSFPTPTFLYRLARKISEIIGIWFFHDERPLRFDEVIKESEKYGNILFNKINWKVILTQGFLVIKKTD